MTTSTTTDAAPSRAWRPTPRVLFSLLLPLPLLALLALQPGWWPWLLAAFVADHLILTAQGLWPRSSALGSNWQRLPPASAARGHIALTIDDGPDPDVTPRVLDLLAAHGAKATFFCVGTRLAACPELARRIVREGHALGNHSAHHRHDFSLMGPWRMRREVLACQRNALAHAGTVPRFFRAPAGLRNVFLDAVLHDAGLQLASWTRRAFDTREGDPQRVLARLTQGLRAGDILLMHDGNAARTPQGEPVILAVLPALLDDIARRGLRTVTLDEAA